jgi:hypothetical protein
MTDKPKRLSDTARTLLTAAAFRDDNLIHPPLLPMAAARQVARSLLNAGLAEVVPAAINGPGYAWRTGENGAVLMLRATALGLARVAEGSQAPAASVRVDFAGETAADTIGTDAADAGPPLATSLLIALPTRLQPPRPPRRVRTGSKLAIATPASTRAAEARNAAAAALGRPRPDDSLRRAAQVLLDAWEKLVDVEGDIADAMSGPIAGLHAALANQAPASISVEASRPPRDTKQAKVLAMLRRDEGASGPQIAEAMGWAPHTVRGFLAGLAKRGISVEVLDRVVQVGPNKVGAKGSFTVYHFVGATPP